MKIEVIFLLLVSIVAGCSQVDSDRQAAEEYYKLAVSLEEDEDFLSAIKAHSKAIELYPEIPRAYLDRSIDYNILNLTTKAIIDVDTFLARVPDAAEAYVWRAEYKRKAGQFISALTDAQKGLELAGGLVKNASPVTYFEGAFDALPMQYGIEPGYATYEIAFAQYELENYQDAINFARWTLTEIPSDGYMDIVIGSSLLHLDSIQSGCNLLGKIEIFDQRELELYRLKCNMVPK